MCRREKNRRSKEINEALGREREAGRRARSRVHAHSGKEWRVPEQPHDLLSLSFLLLIAAVAITRSIAFETVVLMAVGSDSDALGDSESMYLCSDEAVPSFVRSVRRCRRFARGDQTPITEIDYASNIAAQTDHRGEQIGLGRGCDAQHHPGDTGARSLSTPRWSLLPA